MSLFNYTEFHEKTWDELEEHRDTILITDRYLPRFEQSWRDYIEYPTDRPPWSPYQEFRVLWFAIDRREPEFLDVCIFVNTSNRFHAIRQRLPRRAFVTCVHVWNYEKRYYVFVRDAWYKELVRGVFSSFVLIDAIGLKRELSVGALSKKQLRRMKRQLGRISRRYRDVLILSVADSVIAKVNWRATHTASYRPEMLFNVFREVRQAFKDALGLDSYGIFIQGSNETPFRELFSISSRHIDLNSLGAPFAHLFDIDIEIRKNIRKGVHKPAEVYIEKDFFYSLNLDKAKRDEAEKTVYVYSPSLVQPIHQWYLGMPFADLEDLAPPKRRRPMPLFWIKWHFKEAVGRIRWAYYVAGRRLKKTLVALMSEKRRKH